MTTIADRNALLWAVERRYRDLEAQSKRSCVCGAECGQRHAEGCQLVEARAVYAALRDRFAETRVIDRVRGAVAAAPELARAILAEYDATGAVPRGSSLLEDDPAFAEAEAYLEAHGGAA